MLADHLVAEPAIEGEVPPERDPDADEDCFVSTAARFRFRPDHQRSADSPALAARDDSEPPDAHLVAIAQPPKAAHQIAVEFRDRAASSPEILAHALDGFLDSARRRIERGMRSERELRQAVDIVRPLGAA
jgi:hypothetical protein